MNGIALSPTFLKTGKMQVKLWGVRGSLPAPLSPERMRAHLHEVLNLYERERHHKPGLIVDDFLNHLPHHKVTGYGGNTSCGEVLYGQSRLLIDGGSGLRAFSDHIMEADPEVKEFHIYFTHFHWDHLIGLPFFRPIYLKGRTVHCYAVHSDLKESLQTMFKKPNFPVPYQVVESQLRLHLLEPRKKVRIGEFEVTPYQLDHPDPCWGARIEAGGKALAWAVDTECTRISREEIGPDLPLYTSADLMVFDAQYSFGEALEKISWGHSSGPMGIDLALRENIKQTLFVHHDPAASDATIRMAEKQTYHYYVEIMKARQNAGLPMPVFKWRFACEGELITV